MSTLLEVSGVSASCDGFKAMNNLSIQIGKTELRAIIGPNGAGKTTFMDIVTGKTKPDQGYVIWGEKSVSLLDMNESQIAQAGIGRKFQKPTVFEEQTVRENITMALKNPRNPLDLLFNRAAADTEDRVRAVDRKSTRLNSSHDQISYAVLCLKKKKRHWFVKLFDQCMIRNGPI